LGDKYNNTLGELSGKPYNILGEHILGELPGKPSSTLGEHKLFKSLS
jgi:hypothetical protein